MFSPRIPTVLLLSLAFIFFSCSSDSDGKAGNVVISFQNTSTLTTEGTSLLQIPLKIEGSSTEEVFVTYEVNIESTAEVLTDVLPATNSTFIIPPGAAAFNMEFSILEDTEVESENELFIIDLISISEGGTLGSNSSHTIEIEADPLVFVSFATSESAFSPMDDPEVLILLSSPYNQDLFIEFDYLFIQDDLSGEDYYKSLEQITIPSGDTQSTLILELNPFYNGILDESQPVATLEIADVRVNSFQSPNDVIIDGVSAGSTTHDINLIDEEEILSVDLRWISPNNDVDLALKITDESGNPIVPASNVSGTDTPTEAGLETIRLNSTLPDGNYQISANWVSGVSTSVQLSLFFTAGSSLTCVDLCPGFSFGTLSEETINNSILIVFNKSGNTFREVR